MPQKERIHTLDEIRGFCVFCMVFDHALFTLGYMYDHNFARNVFDILSYISPAFAAVFVMLCGISCFLSRNNLLRALKILGVSVLITAITLVIMPEAPIIFGILHLLGVCILLFLPLKKLIEKTPATLGLVLCAVLFLVTYHLPDGYLGFGKLQLQLPSELYSSESLMLLGFRSPASAYSDYFPLLPWMFAFLSGAFVGKWAKAGKIPSAMYKSRAPLFSVLGQNAFLIYIAHQPLIFGAYYLISLFGGL